MSVPVITSSCVEIDGASRRRSHNRSHDAHHAFPPRPRARRELRPPAVQHGGHHRLPTRWHLHMMHATTSDECTIAVDATNPAGCTPNHACKGHAGRPRHADGCGQSGRPARRSHGLPSRRPSSPYPRRPLRRPRSAARRLTRSVHRPADRHAEWWSRPPIPRPAPRLCMLCSERIVARRREGVQPARRSPRPGLGHRGARSCGRA